MKMNDGVNKPRVCKKGLCLILFFPLFLGCEDQNDCVTTNTSEVLLNFFVLQNGRNPQQVQVAFDSVYTRGVDSVFYVAGDTVSTMHLPVNPYKSSITYFFDSPNFRDSLTLDYNRKPRLISPICGTEPVYQNLTIGATTFDSVAVTEKKLTYNANNISIYF